MITDRIASGMVFALNDHSKLKSTNDLKSHKYMVIGIDEASPHGMYQCFCITSMYKREVTLEIPVVVQGTVGYLVPSNIHSFTAEEMNEGSFCGIITDTRWMHVADFLELCLDVHRATILQFMDYEKYKSILLRLHEYCEAFFKENKNVPEYRYSRKAETGGSIYYRYKVPDEIKKLLNEDVPEEHLEIEVKKDTPIPTSVQKQISKQKKRSKKKYKKPDGFDKLWEEYIEWKISTAEFLKVLGMTQEAWAYWYKKYKESGKLPESRQHPFFSSHNPYRDLYKKGYKRITEEALDEFTDPTANAADSKLLRDVHLQKLINICDKEPRFFSQWSDKGIAALRELREKSKASEISKGSKKRKSDQTWYNLFAKLDELDEMDNPGENAKQEKTEVKDEKMVASDIKLLGSVERFNRNISKWSKTQLEIAADLINKYGVKIISENSNLWPNENQVTNLKILVNKRLTSIKNREQMLLR